MTPGEPPYVDSAVPNSADLADEIGPPNSESRAADSLPQAPPKSAATLPFLRFYGDELERACKVCAEDLSAQQEWDDKFLVVDTWLRFFDGEPIQPTPVSSGEKGIEQVKAAEDSADRDGDISRITSGIAQSATDAEAAAAAPEPKRKKQALADVQVEIGRKFAKFKRVKEAFKLFEERFKEDIFSTVVPRILQAAASVSKVEGAVATLASSNAGVLHLQRPVVRSIVANCFLLNVKGLPDMQKLYLSSANAAPHKILCLLAFLRQEENEDLGELKLGIHRASILEVNLPEEEPDLQKEEKEKRGNHLPPSKSSGDEPMVEGQVGSAEVEVTKDEDQTDPPQAPEPGVDAVDDATRVAETEEEKVAKEGLTSQQAELKAAKAAAQAEKAAKASESVGKGPRCGAAPPVRGEFLPDMTAALKDDSAQYSLIVIQSGPGTFGRVADVKTPHEEVPVWEMPELLCFRPLFGLRELQEDEFITVSGLRRVNRCCVQGPLLQVAQEAPTPTVVDILAFDLVRFVDDRRYSLATLRHDIRKWTAVYAGTARVSPSEVVVSHPPLLGVEKHAAFALHLAACGFAWHGRTGEEIPRVRYVLSDEGYATGQDPANELSASQAKEAKHFEALAARMVSSEWSSSEVLALLAIYPFARSSENERFHAFWTRRLRSGGKPTGDELLTLAQRQAQLTPLDPPPREPAPPPSRPRPIRAMPKAKTDIALAAAAAPSSMPAAAAAADMQTSRESAGGGGGGAAAAPAEKTGTSSAGSHPGLSMALPDSKPRPRGGHHSAIVGQRQHTVQVKAPPMMPRPGLGHQQQQFRNPPGRRVEVEGFSSRATTATSSSYGHSHQGHQGPHGHHGQGPGQGGSGRNRSRSRGQNPSRRHESSRGERSRRSQSRDRDRRRHHQADSRRGR